ncbi:MAG: hypothetical protein ACTTKW_07515 [Schwartzia sp. (in: firmicutes)]
MTGWRKYLTVAALCLGAACARGEAAPLPAVPDTIYEWVQSSARMNYFFNKEQIHYGVDEKGFIDLDVLVVPTLKTYDTVQIDDVLEKRRWRDQPTVGFEGLSGEAAYIRIDLKKREVVTDTVHLLDFHLSTLEETKPGDVVKIDTLSPKNLSRVFYEAIIAYAEKHQETLIARTKGELTEADRTRLERERHEREKALEKERQEAEKRMAKERKAAEKAAREKAKAEEKARRTR